MNGGLDEGSRVAREADASRNQAAVSSNFHTYLELLFVLVLFSALFLHVFVLFHLSVVKCLLELFLSFHHHVGPRYQTQAMGFGS